MTITIWRISVASPQPPAGSFDPAAAERGDALFSGKAKCNNCHVEPLWTDTGWNLHMPSEICIDSFLSGVHAQNCRRLIPLSHSLAGDARL
jgi:hypothetical protein